MSFDSSQARSTDVLSHLDTLSVPRIIGTNVLICVLIYKIEYVHMITKIQYLPWTWTSLATDTFERVRTC